MRLMEGLVRHVFREVLGAELPEPFPRMTYAEAMRRYGSDKPDLRFGCELSDLTKYFAGTEFRVFQAPYVGAVVMPGGGSQSRRELDLWQEWARSRGARGLAYALIGADGGISGPVAKNLSEAERSGLAAATGEFSGFHLSHVSLGSWLALLYLIGPGSILALSAYSIAVRSLPTSTVATYPYVNPVVAVILGTTILNEKLTPMMLLGGALIITAVALIVWRRGSPGH